MRALVPSIAASLVLLAGSAFGVHQFGDRAEAASSIQVTDGIPSTPASGGEFFFDVTVDMSYAGGSVVLAANSDGTGSVAVDDEIIVTVTHEDSSTSQFVHDYSNGCQGFISYAGPHDVTGLFASGTNQVRVQFRDLCGGIKWASSYWLAAGTAPPSLEVLGFFGGGPASEKQCYELIAILRNNSASPITRTLSINESATYRGFASQDVGTKKDQRTDCDGDGALSRTMTIPAGSTATFRFAIKHDWDWVPPPNELKNAALLVPKLIAPFLPGGWPALIAKVTAGLISVGNAADLAMKSMNAAPEADYRYSVNLAGIAGSAGPQTVSAKVNPWKVGWIRGAVTAQIEQAVTCPFWWSIIGAIACGTSVGMSWGSYRNAYDPLPDYTALVDPVPVDPGAGATLEPELAHDWFSQLLLAQSFETAAGEAAIRAAAAEEAGAWDWVSTQLTRSRTFLLEAVLARIKAEAMLRGLEAAGPLGVQDQSLYESLLLIASGGGGDDVLSDLPQAQLGEPPNVDELLIGSNALASGETDAIGAIIKSDIKVRVENLGQPVDPVSPGDVAALQSKLDEIAVKLGRGSATDPLLTQILQIIEDLSQLLNESGDTNGLAPLLDQALMQLSDFAGLPADNTAPETRLTTSGDTGARDWYTSDVSIAFDATDMGDFGAPGSGIHYTTWRLNGGAWQDYSRPFTIGDEGWNILNWYSVDKADNVETAHEFKFKLDKTRPNISITSGETDDITWDQAHLEHGILSNDATLAVAGSATDNLCLWEVRAVDVDSGATLASQQPAGANTPDWPPPYPPSSLAWSLNVPLHTGINTIDIAAEDCAGWTKAIRTQVVYIVPGPFDPRSKGFWDNAVKTKKYTSDEMQTFLSYINVASDVWGNDASRNRYGPLTMSNYLGVLGVAENSSDMELKMESQLLADWLNMVSGRLAVKKAVDVSPIDGWATVMNDIGGNPLTYAYRVTLEVEETAQPAPAPFTVNLVSKNLLEGVNLMTIIVP